MFTIYQVAEILGRERQYIRSIADELELPFDRGPRRVRMYSGKEIFKLFTHEYSAINVDPEWGAWFAGLTDGEANFHMIKNNSGRQLQPQFAIKMSDYEERVLREIAEQFNKPNAVYFGPGYTNSQGYKSRPMCEFRVGSANDCFKIVQILRRFPLRSDKAKDFELWSEFVELKIEHRYDRNPQIISRQWEIHEELSQLRQSRRIPR